MFLSHGYGLRASSQAWYKQARTPCCCTFQAPSSSWRHLQSPQSPALRLQTPFSIEQGQCISNKQRVQSIWASAPLPQPPKPLWPIRIPPPLLYSSNLSDVDPVQLSELWAKTLKVSRDPKKILKALRHSFTFVIVLAVQENGDLGTKSFTKLVGVGRAVSDGSFIATICDVAVHPEYQKQGVGRRIVKRLVQDMKRKGGPTGFAVFPPPLARRFFWLIGFRSDRKYCLMAYRGKDDLDKSSNEVSIISSKS